MISSPSASAPPLDAAAFFLIARNLGSFSLSEFAARSLSNNAKSSPLSNRLASSLPVLPSLDDEEEGKEEEEEDDPEPVHAVLVGKKRVRIK